MISPLWRTSKGGPPEHTADIRSGPSTSRPAVLIDYSLSDVSKVDGDIWAKVPRCHFRKKVISAYISILLYLHEPKGRICQNRVTLVLSYLVRVGLDKIRVEYLDLFGPTIVTMQQFMWQDNLVRVAHFVFDCFASLQTLGCGQ